MGKKTAIEKVLGIEPELNPIGESMASLIDSIRGINPGKSVESVQAPKTTSESTSYVAKSISKSSSQSSIISLTANLLPALDLPKSRLSHMISAEFYEETNDVQNHRRLASETPSSMFTIEFPLDKSSFMPTFPLVNEDDYNEIIETNQYDSEEQIEQIILHYSATDINSPEQSPNVVNEWLSATNDSEKRFQSLGRKLMHKKILKIDETDSNNISAFSLSRDDKNLNENIASFGYILITNEDFQVYENYISPELFDLLKITSNHSASSIRVQTNQVVKCIHWQSPAPPAIFDKSISGKMTVKKGSLLSLVGLLISQESVADPDYLKDMLSTYRYYSHPIDICRILIIRYMEIYHDLINESYYSGKSQLESNAFTQMRILNVFKKWTTDFTEDFVDYKQLDHLLSEFLTAYVLTDPKRSMFATNIMEKIVERQSVGRLGHISVSEEFTTTFKQTLEEDTFKSEANLITSASFKSVNSLAMRRGSQWSQPVIDTQTIKSDDAIFDKKSIIDSSSKSIMKSRTGSMDFLRKSPSSYKSPSYISSILTKKKSTISTSYESDRRSSHISASGIDDNQMNIGDFDPDEIGTQLTLLEQQQFAGIPIFEFYNQKFSLFFIHLTKRWNSKTNKELLAPNLVLFIQWFNHVASSFASEVVKQLKLKKRVSTLKRIIYIAHFCLKNQNYNTCFEIVAGLNSTAIQRLKQTWKALPKKYLDVWDIVNNVVSNESNLRLFFF